MQFQVGSGTPSEERAYALMSQVHQQACSTVCGMGWGSWATGAGSDQPADRLAS